MDRIGTNAQTGQKPFSSRQTEQPKNMDNSYQSEHFTAQAKTSLQSPAINNIPRASFNSPWIQFRKLEQDIVKSDAISGSRLMHQADKEKPWYIKLFDLLCSCFGNDTGAVEEEKFVESDQNDEVIFTEETVDRRTGMTTIRTASQVMSQNGKQAPLIQARKNGARLKKLESKANVFGHQAEQLDKTITAFNEKNRELKSQKNKGIKSWLKAFWNGV